LNSTVRLIYPGHCTPISTKIGKHLLKLCTKVPYVFWCVFYGPQYLYGLLINFSIFTVFNCYYSL